MISSWMIPSYRRQYWPQGSQNLARRNVKILIILLLCPLSILHQCFTLVLVGPFVIWYGWSPGYCVVGRSQSDWCNILPQCTPTLVVNNFNCCSIIVNNRGVYWLQGDKQKQCRKLLLHPLQQYDDGVHKRGQIFLADNLASTNISRVSITNKTLIILLKTFIFPVIKGMTSTVLTKGLFSHLSVPIYFIS